MSYPFNTKDVVKESARWGLWAWIVSLVALAVIGGIIWLIFGLNTATSDIRGRGGAIQNKNSAVNRVAAQQQFETDWQDILAADRRIDVLYQVLQGDPKDPVAQTNYSGAVLICQQNVADYNALAQQYLSKDFRPANLPETIDNTDPTTDCKENQK